MKLPRIRRAQNLGWVVDGTRIRLRRRDSRWRVQSCERDLGPTARWLETAGLSFAVFPTRREALTAVAAAMALSDPPADHVAKLRRAGPGRYETQDGRYWVVRATQHLRITDRHGNEHARWDTWRILTSDPAGSAFPVVEVGSAATLRDASVAVGAILARERHRARREAAL